MYCLDPAKAVAYIGHTREECSGAKCSIRLGLQAKGQGNGRLERGDSIKDHRIPNLSLCCAQLLLVSILIVERGS